jgi:hypothetical protein
MASKRLRDKRYTRWLATANNCVVCGTGHTVSPHHLLKVPSEPSAMGLRSGDNWCVPLCHEHHVGATGVHQHECEIAFFSQHNIDPLILAEAFYTYYQRNIDV